MRKLAALQGAPRLAGDRRTINQSGQVDHSRRCSVSLFQCSRRAARVNHNSAPSSWHREAGLVTLGSASRCNGTPGLQFRSATRYAARQFRNCWGHLSEAGDSGGLPYEDRSGARMPTHEVAFRSVGHAFVSFFTSGEGCMAPSFPFPFLSSQQNVPSCPRCFARPPSHGQIVGGRGGWPWRKSACQLNPVHLRSRPCMLEPQTRTTDGS